MLHPKGQRKGGMACVANFLGLLAIAYMLYLNYIALSIARSDSGTRPSESVQMPPDQTRAAPNSAMKPRWVNAQSVDDVESEDGQGDDAFERNEEEKVNVEQTTKVDPRALVRSIAQQSGYRQEQVAHLTAWDLRRAIEEPPVFLRNRSLTEFGVPEVPECPRTPVHHRVDFTLVTQLSEERLGNIPELCRRWQGPIVVAILSKNRGGSDVPDLPNQCPNVKMLLIYVPGGNQKSYPINQLRNLAIAEVKTTHFMVIDADLWPSGSLYKSLLDFTSERRGSPVDPLRTPRMAIVVPAFSYEGPMKKTCNESAQSGLQGRCSTSVAYRSAIPDSFAKLKACVLDKNCFMFDRRNPSGHGSTNYQAWTIQRSLRRIKCFKSARYEPYVLLRTCDAPLYDERFFGYGKNKIQHVFHLRYAGFFFEVYPREFLMHIPHKISKAKEAWRDNEHRDSMDQLYKRFQQQVRASYEVPLTPLCDTYTYS